MDHPDPRLDAARVFYACLAAAGGGQLRERLEHAFEIVPREHFLGPGPWCAVSPAGYVRTPDADPIHVYQNALFALDRSRGINNGEPTLHGQLLGALAPERGDRAIHVGCGTGYYTAILGLLVLPAGRVTAYEIEADLAEKARQCLAPWDNVEVIVGSGSERELGEAEAIYVSAGATRPAKVWLDALVEGGRLVMPLVGDGGWGVSLLVVRQGDQFDVRVITRSAFIDCAGVNEPTEGKAVTAAVRSGRLFQARTLHRDASPDDTAVLAGDGWWLSSRPIGGKQV